MVRDHQHRAGEGHRLLRGSCSTGRPAPPPSSAATRSSTPATATAPSTAASARRTPAALRPSPCTSRSTTSPPRWRTRSGSAAAPCSPRPRCRRTTARSRDHGGPRRQRPGPVGVSPTTDDVLRGPPSRGGARSSSSWRGNEAAGRQARRRGRRHAQRRSASTCACCGRRARRRAPRRHPALVPRPARGPRGAAGVPRRDLGRGPRRGAPTGRGGSWPPGRCRTEAADGTTGRTR